MGLQSRRGAREDDEEEEEEDTADEDEDDSADTSSLPVGAAFVAAETDTRARSSVVHGQRGPSSPRRGRLSLMRAVVVFVVVIVDAGAITAAPTMSRFCSLPLCVCVRLISLLSPLCAPSEGEKERGAPERRRRNEETASLRERKRNRMMTVK